MRILILTLMTTFLISCTQEPPPEKKVHSMSVVVKQDMQEIQSEITKLDEAIKSMEEKK